MSTYLRLYFTKCYHHLFLLFLGCLIALTFLPSAFAAPLDDFVFTVKTDIVTPNEKTFMLPLTGTGYSFDVFCDSADLAHTFSYASNTDTCTYATAGTYTIRIVDTSGSQTGFPRFKFSNGDEQKLISHDQWGSSKWDDMNSAFASAINLTTTATDIPNFTSVSSLQSMFSGATIATPSTAGWDTSNITSMHSMFLNTDNATPDTSTWDTANVVTMSSMFYNAKLANPVTTTVGDIWNTSSVTSMYRMFANATVANPDTSGWDTGSVSTMYAMFASASMANPDTSNWDVSQVTNMSSIFYYAPEAIPDTSNWNTSNVTTMYQMFFNASKANPDTSGWNTANVTDMSLMFHSALLAQPITTTIGNIWNTSNVTSMAYMFKAAPIANPDTSGWVTGSVTTMLGMFYGASLANADTSNWDTANVTNMQYMYANAASAQPVTSNWDTSQVTTMAQMFYGASTANPDTSAWDVSNVTDMEDMFRDAYAANPDVSHWDTTAVLHMYNMFNMVGANVINPDMSGWALSQTTATSLETILSGATLTTQNYDKFLMALKTSVDLSAFSRVFSAGDSKYCISKVQQETLDPTDGWSITDGGYVCSSIAPDLVDSSDSGISNIDNITSITSPTFSLYCPQSDSVIKLYSDIISSTVAFSTYSCSAEGYINVIANLSEATHTLTFTTTPTSGFGAGTESVHSPSLTVTVDSTLADLRVPNLLPASDAGTSNIDNLTNLTSLDFAVYCPTATSDLRLMFDDGSGDTEIASLTCSTIGWTTIANTATWPDGDLTVTVIELDGSLNEIAHSLPLALKIDSSLPSITVLVDKLTSVSDDASTSLVTGQVLGAFTAGDLIEVEVDTITYTGTVNSDGKYAIEVPKASLNNDSSVDVSITITDSFNQSVTGMTTLTVIDETDAFIFTIQTDIVTPGEKNFMLPLTGAGYSFDVYCDSDDLGNTFSYSSNTDTCTYASAGEYTIIIQDTTSDQTGFPRFRFNSNVDAHKLISHDQWGNSKWDDMTDAFRNTSNLLTTAIDIPDLSNVESMQRMFYQASLATPSTANWDTSNITNMSETFREATVATPDTNSWETANVITMASMFSYATNATPETSTWKTANVTNMSFMFDGANNATPITATLNEVWNTSNVTSMEGMFRGATLATPDTSDWNTSNITNMSQMFSFASIATPDTSTWDTSEVTSMASMFRNAFKATPDTSNWNTSKVNNMAYMFAGAADAAPNTSTWNTAQVTNMAYMFDNAVNATPITTTSGDIWNTSQVENMAGMFKNADLVNPDTSNWDTANVTSFYFMFFGATNATPDTSDWNTANATLMSSMFAHATHSNPIVTNWDITNVSNMIDMFDGVKLPTQSYDTMLKHWQGQTVDANVFFDGGLSNYCVADTERASLGTDSSWTITDAGQDCSSIAPDLIDSSDSGISNTDDITNVSTPTFSVYCPASATTVTLYSNLPSANTTIGAYACTAQAYVEIAASTLSDATHTITFTATLASVESAPYGSLSVEIDSSLPDFPSLSVTINKLTSTSGNTSTSLVTGQATGDFTAGDSISIIVNNVTYTGTVDSQGKYAIEVSQSELYIDSSVDASMTITDSFGQSVTDSTTAEVIDETDAFIFTIKTDIVTSGEKTFILPLTGVGYNFEYICDSTTPGVLFSYVNNSDTCTYGSAGEYTVIIRDLSGSKTGFPRFKFDNGDAHKLISHDQWGTSLWETMSQAFTNANNLLTTGLDIPNFSNVQSMYSMFYQASLANPSTTNWGTSTITNMSQVFRGAELATPDTGGWDTTNVTNMNRMFAEATNANPNTSTWKTANVTDMHYMFYLAENAEPITTTFGNIWNTSNVTTMASMFRGATLANPDTSGWDTSNVTLMADLFSEATNAVPDTSAWNTANVTAMQNMFHNAVNATPVTTTSGNIWNTANVTSMHEMFNGASLAAPNTSGWNTANVTDMAYMFKDAVLATPDTSNWDTSKVTTMRAMFMEAANATPDTRNWDTSNVTDMAYMFMGATNASPDTSAWNTANITDMIYMFYSATKVNPVVTNWNISNVSNMNNMFFGVTLPTQSYDTMLKHWQGQTVSSSITFDGGLSNYCLAQPERDAMTSASTNTWTITDANLDCSTLVPASAADLLASSDLGVSDADNITSKTTPSFEVYCPTDNAIIKLYSDQPSSNTEIASDTCTATGNSNITANALALGLHNISYTQTVGATTSGHSPTLAVTIEPVPIVISTPPTVTITSALNSLISAQTNLITFDFSESISGFELSDIAATNGTLSGFVNTSGQSQWTTLFTPAVNFEGTGSVSIANAAFIDGASNSGIGAQISFAIDTLGPNTILSTNPIDRTAIVELADGISLLITGTVSGDYQAGDIVTLLINGQNYNGTVDEQGLFSIPVRLIDLNASDQIQTSITVTDQVGNSQTTNEFTSYSSDINQAPVAATQSVTMSVETETLITLSASDPDNDPLIYTISQQPQNGVLVGSGKNITYTPDADFHGLDSFIFMVTDPLQASSLAQVNITVLAPVINLLAVPDQFTITSLEPVILDVLANDQIESNITVQLNAATAFGLLQIIDNKIEYTPAQELSGDIEITYTISSAALNTTSSAIVTVSFPNESAPDITVPADLCDELSVNSNALYTKVDLGEATAIDRFGNALPVSLTDGNLLYPPGINKAYWQAVDSEGVKSIKAQIVCVHPLISLHKNQQIERGETMQVGVYLNGESPIYPLIIDYAVSSGNSEQIQPLTTGSITIEQGTGSVIDLDPLFEDLFPEDDRLRIDLSNSLNLGSTDSHLLSFTSTTAEPEIHFAVQQSNQNRYTLAKEQGLATITTTIVNVKELNDYAITWMYNEQEIENLSTVADQIEFQLTDFELGHAKLTAVITDENGSVLDNHDHLDLEIIQQFAQLTNIDSDGDLISDLEEGFQDNDKDFTPDYLDRIDECNVLQQNSTEFDAYLIESNAGFCLRRGKLTIGNTGGGAQLTSVDINNSLSDTLTPDLEATNVGGLFDFVAQGSITPVNSFVIVIPQRKPIPIAAIYRKLLANGQWQDFIEDDINSLWSTAGEPGYCPPPNTNTVTTSPWERGLIEGYWCVQLVIEDGGNNDQDKQINGRIIDLGGVGVQNNTNHLPIAFDDIAQLKQHNEVSIEVLINDTDADNDPLTITSASVNIGTVSFDDNQVYYQGNENYAGDITIHYGISDGNGGTDIGTAIVSAYVNTPPTVINDQASTDNATVISVDVLANDSDNVAGSLQLSILTTTSGVAKVVDDQVLFTPDANFVGMVTVVYQLTDPEGASAKGELEIDVSEAHTRVEVKLIHGGASETLLLLLFLMTWLRLIMMKRQPVC